MIARLPRPLAAPLLLLALLLAPALSAQDPDRVVLKNGDTLTGTVKTMGGGKLTLTHPLVGEIVIPLADVQDLVTGQPVVLVTTGGERLERRVTGIEDGRLQLAARAEGGPPLGALAVADLDAINPPPAPAPAWTGAINVGANVSTGNTNRRSVAAGAEAKRRSEFDRITAKSAWSYADEKIATGARNRTERRLEGSLQYDYFLSKKSYLLATTSALNDERADLDLRYTAGAGYGYQWVEDPELAFATEAGVNYFSENFGSSPDQSSVSARLAYHLLWQIADGFTFLQDVEYYPSFEKGTDLFVTKDSRFKLGLTESMFAQLQWILAYDSTPGTGLDRADNRYLLSVGWSF